LTSEPGWKSAGFSGQIRGPQIVGDHHRGVRGSVQLPEPGPEGPKGRAVFGNNHPVITGLWRRGVGRSIPSAIREPVRSRENRTRPRSKTVKRPLQTLRIGAI